MTSTRRARWLYAALVIFIVCIFLKNAWISEDAYISFRSVEQYWQGAGPRWNPHERVQVYTSPLWFWLCALSRPLFPDPFIQTLILSFLCLTIFLTIAGRHFGTGRIGFAAIAMLLLSRAFFDYTTSGLENILAAVLLAGFIRCVLKPAPEAGLSRCSDTAMLLAGLAVVCRHDLVFLTAPTALLLIVKEKHLHRAGFAVRRGILFCLPVCLWSLFSLIFYGFLFPNTAYAKLYTGIPRTELIIQGFRYFMVNLLLDPMTLVIIVFSIVRALGRRSDPIRRSLAAGILLYLAYLVWIGGDFMLGRFLSGPFVVAWMLSKPWLTQFTGCHAGRIFGAAVVALVLIFVPGQPITTSFDYANKSLVSGIADERGFYFNAASIYPYFSRRDVPVFPDHQASRAGYVFAGSPMPVRVETHVGFFGYWSGTKKIIIDRLALTDPLLSKLPVITASQWRPGHFERSIPPGYIESIVTGVNRIEDSEVAALYDSIRRVTTGPLWTRERWRTIFVLNVPFFEDSPGIEQ